MLGQLRLKRPVQQPAGEMRQHPVRPSDLLRRARARQQRIQHLIRDLRLLLAERRPAGNPGNAFAARRFGSLRSPTGLAPLLARPRQQLWMNTRRRFRHGRSFRPGLHGSSDTPSRPPWSTGATECAIALPRARWQLAHRSNARTGRARRRIGVSARALPDRDHAGMSARRGSPLDRVPVWARRGLMVALPLLCLRRWSPGSPSRPPHPPATPADRASTSIASSTLPPPAPSTANTDATASPRTSHARRF